MKNCKFDFINSKNERVPFTYSFEPKNVDTGFVLDFATEGELANHDQREAKAKDNK